MMRMGVLGVLLLFVAAGCDARSDAERCREIDNAVVSAGEQLPLLCEEDIDCHLIDGYHPERPVVSNTIPVEDLEHEDLLRRRVELCGEFSTKPVYYRAECVRSACTLRAVESVRDGDVGVFDAGVVADTEPAFDDACECTADSDCTDEQACINNCTCQALSICEAACLNVDGCGLIDELGLGSSVENCTMLCDADLETRGPELAECVIAAECDRIGGCFQ